MIKVAHRTLESYPSGIPDPFIIHIRLFAKFAFLDFGLFARRLSLQSPAPRRIATNLKYHVCPPPLLAVRPTTRLVISRLATPSQKALFASNMRHFRGQVVGKWRNYLLNQYPSAVAL